MKKIQKNPQFSNLKKLTLSLLLLAPIITQCSDKCINCMPKGCYRCKFKTTLKTFKCSEENIKIPNCEVSREQDGAGICSMCAETYVLSKDRKSCQISKIKNCRISYIDDDGVEKCSACINSQPNRDNTKCEGSNKVENCLYVGKKFFQYKIFPLSKKIFKFF